MRSCSTPATRSTWATRPPGVEVTDYAKSWHVSDGPVVAPAIPKAAAE